MWLYLAYLTKRVDVIHEEDYLPSEPKYCNAQKKLIRLCLSLLFL